MTTQFTEPPELPPWLEEQLPFNRRTFSDAGHDIHFIDEGEGPTVLLLHGNPTWCYLWRKVIRILAKEKIRIIAPDLIGLGLSSKPMALETHTLDFHADRISALVRALDLESLTIAAQDWGGPISAIMAARNRERIHGAVFANTGIRVPTKQPRVTAFHKLSHRPVISDLIFRVFNYPVKKMYMVQGDRSSIGPAERRAYLYPFPTISDRAAPLALARMVPINLESPTIPTLQEADDWARSFKGPVKLVWGRRDPILGRTIYPMKKLFPDAAVTETGAGHFLQEEVPEELAAAILQTVRDTPAQM